MANKKVNKISHLHGGRDFVTTWFYWLFQRLSHRTSSDVQKIRISV